MHRRRLLCGSLAATAAGLAGCVPAFPPERIAREYPPIGRFVETPDGLRVHYTDSGAGQPVVLIHGASGNLRDMEFTLAPLVARRRRAISIDRPGFGYTDRPAERGSDPAVQARILRNAVQAMGVERPIILGHSWAGALVLAWALQFPDELAGVVVLSGATMPWGGGLAFYYTLGASPVFGGLVADTVAALASQDRINSIVRRVFRPQQPPPGYAAYVGGPLAIRPETIRANSKDLEGLNTALKRQSKDYGRITLPVEVLHGTEDKIVGPGVHAVPLVAKLPDAGLTLIEGIGHMPHHVATGAILRALDRIDPL